MRRANRVRLARAALRNQGVDTSGWSEQRLHREYERLSSRICVCVDQDTGKEFEMSSLKIMLNFNRIEGPLH